MPKFFENLLSFLQAFPRYVQLSFYILIIIAGVYFYNAITGTQSSSLEGYSHLVSSRPSDALITSSGTSGNYVFVTRHDDSPLTYWPSYQAFEKKREASKQGRFKGEKYSDLVKYGTLCVYNADFSFGYKDRGRIASWFSGNTTSAFSLPTILSANIYSQQNMATKKQGVILANKCMEYVSGVDQVKSQWAQLNQECKKEDEGACLKQRMARWLQNDKVLKDHLKQGVISVAAVASGELSRCKLISANSNASVIEPNYCSAYQRNEQYISQNSINTNLTMAMRYLDTLDLNQCYLPQSGGLNTLAQCDIDAPVQILEQTKQASSAALFSVFNKAYAAGEETRQNAAFPEKVTNTAFMQTYSTLAVFSAIHEKWFNAKDDEYAFRKDVSQVYFGVDIPTSVNPLQTVTLGNSTGYKLYLAEPDVKSINRWTQDYGYIYDGNANLLNTVAQKMGGSIYSILNQKIQVLLDDAIKRNEKHAIAQAKKILENRYAIDNIYISFDSSEKQTLVGLIKETLNEFSN